MSRLQKEQDAGYSTQSQHFHNTRKKRRPEVDHLIASLKDRTPSKKKFSLVDLGCGAGRLSALLTKQFPSMKYVGVDSAEGMVEQATKEFPAFTFEHNDMISYVREQQQESIDCIVALASFQHVQTKENHLLFLSHTYKSLERGGRCYLVNRSYSDWFLGKYRKLCLKAVFRSLWKRGRDRNDVIIPWKDKSFHKNGLKFNRMYHMFTLYELKKLASTVGFVVKEVYFVGQDGEKTDNRRKARNSYIVLEKSIHSA